MPDNYKPFSNGRIRQTNDVLNGFYPKFALHKVDEKFNANILTANAAAAYIGDSNFYIIESDTSGWGDRYLIVYATDYSLSVVVHFVGGGSVIVPPPPPAPTPSNGASWGTYSATIADGSFYYGKTVANPFTVKRFNYSAANVGTQSQITSNGSTQTTTLVNQQYNDPEGEIYMVDMGDGYIARLTSKYTLSSNNYYDADNRHLAQMIDMTTGAIVNTVVSLVRPIIFDGIMLLCKNSDNNPNSNNVARYTYQGAGVWTFAEEVPVALATNFNYHLPYIRFQRLSSIKFIVDNYNDTYRNNRMMVITDYRDLSKTTFSNSLYPEGVFELTVPEIVGRTQVQPDQSFDTIVTLLNASDFSPISGLSDFIIPRAQRYSLYNCVIDRNSAAKTRYVVMSAASAYVQYDIVSQFSNNNSIEFNIMKFPADAIANPGSANISTTKYSSRPDSGLPLITYIEDQTYIARGAWKTTDDFAIKGTILYAPLAYKVSSTSVCVGFAIVDPVNSAITIRSITLPVPVDTYILNTYYQPLQVFVDASNIIYAVFTVYDNSGVQQTSLLLRLENGVISKFNLNLNHVLPVGTSTLYTFNEGSPAPTTTTISPTTTTTVAPTTTTVAPTTTLAPSTIWGTYSATNADGSFYYDKTIVPDFTIIEFYSV